MKTDRLDLVYTGLIIILIAVSTGHVGQLFADRETERAQALGYVMALALDGVLVVSLHQTARAAGWDRAIPFGVFSLACAVSAGFNYQYYRESYSSDPVWVSATLGIAPPLLAALMSVLRALRTNTVEETQLQREETERQAANAHALEMESLRLDAETKVQIAVGTAKEESRQANAAVRLAKVQEAQRKAQEEQAQQVEGQRKAIENLGVCKATFDYYLENPRADRATAANALGVTKRTVGNHLKRLEDEFGVIRNNGSGVEVVT